MERILDFLAMGGYAAFVWPAYAIAALVLVALLWHSLHTYRTRQRDLARLEPRAARRHAPDAKEARR